MPDSPIPTLYIEDLGLEESLWLEHILLSRFKRVFLENGWMVQMETTATGYEELVIQRSEPHVRLLLRLDVDEVAILTTCEFRQQAQGLETRLMELYSDYQFGSIGAVKELVTYLRLCRGQVQERLAYLDYCLQVWDPEE